MTSRLRSRPEPAEFRGFIFSFGSTPSGRPVSFSVHAHAPTWRGEAEAACAASLALDSKASLASIGEDAPTELMVWTEAQVWYQTRMPSTHLVLAVSSDHGHAGALRLAVRRELAELRDALTQL